MGRNDSFNENDLADLNSSTPAASESPDLTPEQDANIQEAADRFFGKVPADTLEKEAAAASISQRRRERTRQAQMEQRDELEDEGLEGDELEEGASPVEADEPQEADAEKPEEPPVGEEAKDIDPTLRYFAEQELGWTKEKLDRLVKLDPEVASETIQNIADSYTNLSRQYAAGSPIPGTQQAPSPAQQQETPLTPRLDKFFEAISDFTEANGNDLGEFALALKAELIDPVKEIFAENKVRELELNKNETLTTFNTLSEKFSDIYGKPGSQTPEQLEAVTQLGNTADSLRAGAKQRGQKMSIKSALNQAHLQVSAPYRAAIERKKLTEQVQKREKTITHRPTQRLVPATSGKSDAAAEEAVAKFAAERGLTGWD